ncbi:lipopolysaccharide biosynthesis protein [Enterococcus sp. AZ196]|uniref:lipopolysaccharide biosynthesis protein n=1 Tax=Enterococcus sp. AZ196 TaxID=2774659 RepID=UPI003D276CF8
MNTKTKHLLKNIHYTVTANFLVLTISVLLNLFVPKFIGVKDYSYWQLYVFYTSYVGLFHLGWLDGIYLKIGGKEYHELDKSGLGSQFWYFFFFECSLSLIFGVTIWLLPISEPKVPILLFTALASVIRNCTTFMLYILQSTNRIKEYAQVSRNDRYVYLVFLSLYLLFGGRDYLLLILLDILARLCVTVWGFYKLKDLFLHKPLRFPAIQPEIFQNIKIGSNLMISNIMGMFIIGVSRIMIEIQWSVETFGKLSLTLGISNMFMTFINAVGVVLFPMLRRTNPKKLGELYLTLRAVFVPISYGTLLTYYPLKWILEGWLPAYKQSFLFMGILFPMILFEGRMTLLITTYLKTIRKEKWILYANIWAFSFSLIGSYVMTFYWKNLLGVVGVIVLSSAIRCVIGELFLAQTITLKSIKSLLIEWSLTTVFIIGNICLREMTSFICYSLCFFAYALYDRSLFLNNARRLVKLARA